MKIVAYINDILFYSHTCANSSNSEKILQQQN